MKTERSGMLYNNQRHIVRLMFLTRLFVLLLYGGVSLFVAAVPAINSVRHLRRESGGAGDSPTH